MKVKVKMQTKCKEYVNEDENKLSHNTLKNRLALEFDS